jgi:plasmid stabilization system protein ParE
VPIRYLPPAQDEFLAAFDFYESEAPGLGVEFDEEVREVEARLEIFPESGSPFTRSTRRILLRSFPFAVIYTAGREEITVIAVAHQRRRPGYWSERRG